MLMASENPKMDFWQQTWQERQDEVKRWFGQTEPRGVVTAFSWKNRIALPGACSLCLPPIHYPHADEEFRTHWLYLTIGLSQPLNAEEVRNKRAARNRNSRYGFELGVLTNEKSSWPSDALYLLLSHITEGVALKWGDRFAFGFHKDADGATRAFTGFSAELGLEAVGEIRAMLFWRYLFPVRTFVTSTGGAMILIGTGITGDEWELAKATRTEHVQLLLCRSGVGQITDPNRQSVLRDSKWQAEWERISKLTGQQAADEVEAGYKLWNKKM